MGLSKKDKSKILVKHLERDFELVSRCGETYVIMSVMDALSEIESLEEQINLLTPPKGMEICNVIFERYEEETND